MYVFIVGRWQRWHWFLIPLCLVVAGVSLFSFPLPLAHYTKALMLVLRPPQAAPVVVPPLPRYTQAFTLGSGMEWRFAPLVVDVNGDGAPDLVATAQLADPALHIWWGNEHTFTPAMPTWATIGYAALATGDINHDGYPDLVGASHFGKVQTLLSDGKGGFTETLMQREDGYVAAQLVDVNGDGELDLLLLGFAKVGIEVYLGDGHGHWTLHTRLPEPPQGAPYQDGTWWWGTSITMGTWTSSPRSTAGGSTFTMAMGTAALPVARWTFSRRGCLARSKPHSLWGT